MAKKRQVSSPEQGPKGRRGATAGAPERVVADPGDTPGDIPDDINWVLRVDGHSDAAPINTVEFPSNWHLSAARAISVVQYLASKGIADKRLVAAGFGEYQPLAKGEGPAAYRRNRRIEFKLTER